MTNLLLRAESMMYDIRPQAVPEVKTVEITKN